MAVEQRQVCQGKSNCRQFKKLLLSSKKEVIIDGR